MKSYNKEIDDKLKFDESRYNKMTEVNIGNPIKVYAEEKERDLFRFLIKPSVAAIFLGRFLKNGKITLMDFGCGNGSNSRVLAKGIFEANPDSNLTVHSIFVDVSGTLLEEAKSRSETFQKEYPQFSFTLLQIDLRDSASIIALSRDFKHMCDFAFSIKCFHNTPLKIDKKISRMISDVLTPGGVFLQQFYIHNSIRAQLSDTKNLVLGRPYCNAGFLDIILADLFLKSAGLKKVYDVKQKNKSKGLIKTNNFYQYALERYYMKA